MDPVGEIQPMVEKAGSWLITSGLQILLILVLMVVGLKVATLLAAKLVRFITQSREDDIEMKKRADTLSSIIRYGLHVFIFIMASMMILKELGVEIGPIMATAGIAGLAIGFGAQKLVEDVISGFFILLEDQIRVGDVVQIADKGGLVERITLRMVILRDLSGNVHYVRNGLVGVVTNMTKEYSFYLFDVGVAYRENVDEVIEILKEVDEGMRQDPEFQKDILDPIEILGLDKFDTSAVIVKARTKTKPIRQWAVGREFNRRLKKIFDERNIEIPFPHVTLYMGRDKGGGSAPLRVLKEKEGA
ncbi:MAG TPA: mechanosensitive ion channel family protein [Candidatus Omnitrophota bacterium]|nr:mechanosensitive ion channel family protein [Candidatus Omnitrophota bacterium]HSA31551.1 mechanosensitive ion channel family protein [Candidatus Omnitrophota bacterium]